MVGSLVGFVVVHELFEFGVDFREELQVKTQKDAEQACVKQQAEAEEDKEQAEEVEGVTGAHRSAFSVWSFMAMLSWYCRTSAARLRKASANSGSMLISP